MKVQELKDQVDELAKQNKTVLDELSQLKELLQQSNSFSANANTNQQQTAGNNSMSNGISMNKESFQQSSGMGNGNAQTQSSSPANGGGQGDGQNSNAEGAQGQQSNSNNNSSQQVPQLADELVKIKDMITTLESKTSSFVTSRSSGKLNQDDIVNLILILMDGMIDWASDFIQKATNNQGTDSNGANGGSGSQNAQQ